MAKIDIYARMRPTDHPHHGITVSQDPDNDQIHIQTGESERSTPSRYSRSHPASHTFQFKRVFQDTATQQEVFDTVSKDIIDSFLEGYNGTIFAYGQTSSGKTHTIEGSGRKFADRGIIPRTLSYVYKEVERRTDSGEDVSVHISYMEIYQDTGYDLLNPGMRPGALMVTLPKINISEGAGGRVIIRNLSSHLAASEEVAQSLLFQGSTCRKVAETSMNQCSSRSHSIFTITLTVKSADSEVITRSKLNLVDLAGSERVSKTGADGRILQEAKHINLSLHHLEHVIVTLQHHLKASNSQSMMSPAHSNATVSLRKSRERSVPRSPGTPKSRESQSTSRPGTRGNHVPYRNCMLTMVLKDSLGGNCLTAMIATISIEEVNSGETVSTLRFSQRVACISNKARKNEELDDKAVIKKLKKRIVELENEVLSFKDRALQQEDSGVSLSGSSSTSQSLTDQEKIVCHQILHGFFHGKIDNPVSAGIDTVPKFQECLQVLKMVVLQALGINKQPTGSNQDQAHAKELASEVKHSLQPSLTTTPSPNSCLSSGFGSLVDTDGMVTSCEASHNQETLTQHPRSPSHTTKASPVQSVQDQLKDQRAQKKTHHQKSRRNEHVNISPGKSTSKYENPHKSPSQAVSPRTVNRAWMSSTMSPRGSVNHSTLTNDPLITSPPISSPSKPLSPRQEKEVQMLMIKQAELKESKQERKQLAGQVQMLNLHVEEEKLRSELDSIGEQLAQQHALVSRLQKTDSEWEQLCAEKIAEQQLRIKQAKAHQQLMDVQYYIQSSQRQDRVVTDSARSMPFPQPTVPTKAWSSPPHVNTQSTKVQREIEKHEIKQTKVQNEIEKLRMSQIEKQLELKEAATRRKILALKQQLLAKHSTHVHSQPKEHSNAAVSTQSPQAQRQHHTEPEPRPIASEVTNTTPVTKSPIFSRIPEQVIFASPPPQPFDRESPLSHIKKNVINPARITHSSPSAPSVLHDSKQHSIDHKPANTAAIRDRMQHSIDHKQANTAIQSPSNAPSIEGNRTTLHTPKQSLNTESSVKSPTGKDSTVKSPPPVKLTLPEEIKETEYMSAVQRQKARVSRIRRCIVAATVIQRAWRYYKQN